MKKIYSFLPRGFTGVLVPLLLAACGRSSNDIDAEITDVKHSYDSVAVLYDENISQQMRLLNKLDFMWRDYMDGSHNASPAADDYKKKQIRLVLDSMLINGLQQKVLRDERVRLQWRLNDLHNSRGK